MKKFRIHLYYCCCVRHVSHGVREDLQVWMFHLETEVGSPKSAERNKCDVPIEDVTGCELEHNRSLKLLHQVEMKVSSKPQLEKDMTVQ